MSQTTIEPAQPPTIRRPPVHLYSAVVTLLLDALWGIPELVGTASGAGIISVPFLMLATGFTCWLAVLLIQRRVAGDSRPKALTKAALMGLIAGVPFMVAGTAVGSFLIGWAGLNRFSEWLVLARGKGSTTIQQLKR